MFCRPPYSGTGPLSLCRLRRQIGLIAVIPVALMAGGCSFSYQLGSLFDKNKDQAAVETTGSIRDKASAKPNDGDLAYARAAASEVLRRGGQGVSQPWE